jgi:Mlc titration factor MtfA (ptsG expression regulator)
MSTDAAHFIFLLLAAVILARGGHYAWVSYKKRRINRTYTDKRDVYGDILSRYNPYYKSLDKGGRDRFLRRVLVFMEYKEFEYIDLEPEERMPLLISAAAIQLTYGLENYLLDYFSTIYILKDNYRYGLYTMPFEGHVSEEGIYLSWSNFIREFVDYSDGQNVGLHEMAHALTYVNFTAQEGRDTTFHDRFKDFSEIGRPIFERMQAGETNLLGSYAATDYQEFWAVCVETFFERSTAFKRQLPELYFSLCTLLNQDPLTPEKVLRPPEAY